ncbi:hypothetical protein ACLIBG_07600 [Virgibacillus sp. W0181]|uniref:hypothetical protein n=1 Tax=Virgibacillus sp. W0181 TaxID=3391581 RepID=UPI003F47708D
MKFMQKWLALIFITTFLTGCLFPQSELSKNQKPNQDQLDMVQQAVDKYKEETGGLLPIRTKPNETPIFQKYLVDFNILKENNIITETPGNAYESGGVYQYTILTPEEDPRVKLIDLRNTETIRNINVKLEMYRSKNIYPPFAKEIEKGIYKLDYEKLGFNNEPHAVSPYSRESLPIVMDTDGKLYIDYRIDLMKALNEFSHDYEEGDDIRYILADNTPFVPVYSLPYTIKNGEPIFLVNN